MGLHLQVTVTCDYPGCTETITVPMALKLIEDRIMDGALGEHDVPIVELDPVEDVPGWQIVTVKGKHVKTTSNCPKHRK